MRTIDADALIEKLRDDAEHMEVEILKLATYAAINDIKHAQTVEPEQKKGKWVQHSTYHGDDTSGFIDPDWRCSECGRQANVNEWFMYDLTDFCPNCGADMRGE